MKITQVHCFSDRHLFTFLNMFQLPSTRNMNWHVVIKKESSTPRANSSTFYIVKIF